MPAPMRATLYSRLSPSWRLICWRNNSVLFVHNLDDKPREIAFAVGLPGRCV